MTIFYKMLIAPLSGVLIFVASLLYLHSQNMDIKDNLNAIKEISFPALELANKNISHLESISKYLKDAVVANEKTWIEESASLNEAVEINLKKLEELLGEKESIESTKKAYKEYYTTTTRLSRVMIDGEDKEEISRLIDQSLKYYSRVQSEFENLRDAQKRAYEEMVKKTSSKMDTILLVGALVGFLATILIVLITFFISLKTRKSLNLVLLSMKNITEGKPDFKSRIEKNSDDEIGEFVEYFNLFTQKLQKDYKNLEVAKFEAEDSYAKLVKTQKKLIETEKMASLGSLVAGVAHEINTPIGTAYTTASHLEGIFKSATDSKGVIDEGKKELLISKTLKGFPLILSNLKRASELIKSFKRVSVDQHVDELKEIDIKEYIEDVANSLKFEYSKKGYTLKIFSKERLIIKTYPGAIAQIITNLVMNSIKHGFKNRDRGDMIIELEKVDESIKIVYKDNGCGIKKENLSRVFDPFFTTDKQDGSGLGMNVLYNLVTQKLNGSVSLRSEIEDGVRVEIEIPFR